MLSRITAIPLRLYKRTRPFPRPPSHPPRRPCLCPLLRPLPTAATMPSSPISAHNPFLSDQQMLFGDLDLDDGTPKHQYQYQYQSSFDFAPSSPTDSYGFYTPEDPFLQHSPAIAPADLYSPGWLHEQPSPSSPIPIPTSSLDSITHFLPFADPTSPYDNSPFSPPDFISPTSSFDTPTSFDGLSISPQETSMMHASTPEWAHSIYDPPTNTLSHHHPRSSTSPGRRPSPLGDPSTRRNRRFPSPRHNALSSSHIFHPSSAPAHSFAAIPMTRSYSSSRAESGPITDLDSGDATVRRKRKISAPDLDSTTTGATDISSDNARKFDYFTRFSRGFFGGAYTNL